MKQLFDKSILFKLLSLGGTIITPNNRLSQHLLIDFYKFQNKSVQEKPHCVPYRLFLLQLYKKVRHLYANISHPILLTASQENCLWAKCIQQDHSTFSQGLLSEIQKAWQQCQHWQVDIRQSVFTEKNSCQQFQEWGLLFEAQLKKLGFITESQLPQYLTQYPNTLQLASLVWAAFDDFTPLQKYLQQKFTENGCEQFIYDLPLKSTPTLKFSAQDNEEELQEMLSWAKQHLHKKVAVIIPDLESKAPYLHRLFAKHFDANEFNISFGQPLSHYPVVSQALAFLRLSKSSLNHSELQLLLQSPYLKDSESEFIARSNFLQESKLMKYRHINFETFVSQLSIKAPKLSRTLKNISDFPEQATVNIWTELFKQRLMQLGFPGEYALNSFTYQSIQRLIHLFGEFLQLSLITPIMTQAEALKNLELLCKNTIFQPQNEDTPIQVLGLLEASGCEYDLVWLSGITDQCLPEKTRLSAFIPIALQRELRMPYALPEQELTLARQRLQRLQNGCREMIVSYPAFIGDIPNLASPLISELPHYVKSESVTLTADSLLESMDEDYVIPLESNESITGGTSLLAYQAQCPFRAFAAHRLYAKSGMAALDGFDPIDRGQLMHKMMEMLWEKLQNQQTLLSTPSADLEQFIETICQKVLSVFVSDRQSLSPLMYETEYLRLKQMLKVALAWEKQREPFAIDALEKEFNFHLEGVEIKVRIDRLDKVANEKWVIDYKTSLPTSKPWNDERPEAPQLLVYSLLDEDIKALLYLELKNGNVQCSGLSALETNISGINTLKDSIHWVTQKQLWLQQLKNLIEEIKQGYCAPIPKRQSICDHCEFVSLCRI